MRLSWRELVLIGAVLVTSTHPTQQDDGPAIFTAGGCSAWPGDTTHHYRGPDPPPLPRQAPVQTLDQDTLVSDLDALGGGLPDLTGTWAQLQITATLSNAPMVGEIRATTTTLLRIELVQQGSSYTATGEICDLSVQSEGGMRTIIPDAFVAAIPAAELRGRIEPFEGGFRVVQAPATQVLGVVLDDPRNDPLPESADDPRVVDPDGDGHPGMSITVDGFIGGNIYMLQRTVRALEGVVRDLDAFDGFVDWSMEQVTLGASSFLLNVDTHARADPTPERNFFRSRRVETNADCASLVSRRPSLFAP